MIKFWCYLYLCQRFHHLSDYRLAALRPPYLCACTLLSTYDMVVPDCWLSKWPALRPPYLCGCTLLSTYDMVVSGLSTQQVACFEASLSMWVYTPLYIWYGGTCFEACFVSILPWCIFNEVQSWDTILSLLTAPYLIITTLSLVFNRLQIAPYRSLHILHQEAVLDTPTIHTWAAPPHRACIYLYQEAVLDTSAIHTWTAPPPSTYLHQEAVLCTPANHTHLPTYCQQSTVTSQSTTIRH